MRRHHVITVVALSILAPGASARLTVAFDYSLDGGGFFQSAAARAALEEAAHVFSDRILDRLSPITPGISGGTANSWDAIFTHPGNGAQAVKTDLVIPRDTVLVYAGGFGLSGGRLASGGPGGFSAVGSAAFVENLQTRGQSGAGGPGAQQSDYSLWGGSLSFNSGVNWNFSLTDGPRPDQYDFFSTAVHELAHVFGFGTAASFMNLTGSGSFEGAKARDEFGGAVPLVQPARGHWAEGVNGVIGVGSQPAAMTPILPLGTRKRFTELDRAAMDDLGWDLAGVGDLDLNGVVDADDYAIIDRGFLQRRLGYRNGDLNGDGTINRSDYALMDAAYLAGGGEGGPLSVPEPQSVAWLSAAAWGCRRRRRGRAEVG